MDTRTYRMLAAAALLAVGVVSADLWRRHGSEMARLAADARADLRDALRAEAKAVTRYYHDPWPYWWGYPHYGWWAERRTFYVFPTPAQPAPAPPPRREADVTVAPRVEVSPSAPPSARPPAPVPAPPSPKVRPSPAPRRIMRELK